ncbi:hypothetical protein D3C76_1195140 [compost metagenome]
MVCYLIIGRHSDINIINHTRNKAARLALTITVRQGCCHLNRFYTSIGECYRRSTRGIRFSRCPHYGRTILRPCDINASQWIIVGIHYGSRRLVSRRAISQRAGSDRQFTYFSQADICHKLTQF